MNWVGFVLFYVYSCLMMAVLMRTVLFKPGDKDSISPLKFWGVVLGYPVAIPIIVILAIREIENESNE